MPNWCTNTLTIVAKTEEEIKAMLASVENTDSIFSLERIDPPPPGLDNNGLYDWHVTHWGTKWDIVEPGVSIPLAKADGWTDGENNYEVTLSFKTAWSPPEKAILTLSRQFPKMCFYLIYDEPGMNFAGAVLVINGEVLEQFETESPSNIEYALSPDAMSPHSHLNEVLNIITEEVDVVDNTEIKGKSLTPVRMDSSLGESLKRS